MGSWHSWVGSRARGKCKWQLLLTVRVRGLCVEACSKQTNLGTAGLVTVPAVQVWLLFFRHSDTTVTLCGYFSKPCPQKQSLSLPIQQCEPLSYILPRLQWDCGTSLRQFVRQGKQENVTANSQGSSITPAFLLALSDCIWEHLDSLKGAAWRRVRGGNFTSFPSFQPGKISDFWKISLSAIP